MAKQAVTCDDIVAWLVDGARSASDAVELLDLLCRGLSESGLPLWRAATFIISLHPQVPGRALFWTDGQPVRDVTAPHGYFATDESLHSPYRRVVDTREKERRRLLMPLRDDDFPVLKTLREEGATDYLALPLFFHDGAVHCASFTTRRGEGFSDADVAHLVAVSGPLARVLEAHTLRSTAATLLDTYVGKQAGSRILAGQIRRGEVIAVDAVIWLSDMRGFTRLADQLEPRALVDMLNRYFDCQAHAVQRHGGEVLKFMGDGMLAIFPVSGRTQQDVASAAAAAAREAHAATGAAFANNPAGAVRFGLGLHMGEVLYGNIGGGERLDFTAIGPAVNLAARLEQLTSELACPVLASQEFAELLPGAMRPAGSFDLPGISGARPVFQLLDVD